MTTQLPISNTHIIVVGSIMSEIKKTELVETWTSGCSVWWSGVEFRNDCSAWPCNIFVCLFVWFWRDSPQWAMASSFTRFLDRTQRCITVGRTPLDEWSARRRDRYLTTQNTHNRQTSMPPGGIRTHSLSRRAAADLRLRLRGHWDRLSNCNTV